MTPHEVLGIPPQASKAEVVAAYRTLVQIFHPDRFVGAPENVRLEAERRMKDLNEAYAAVRSGTPPRWSEASRPKPPASARPPRGADNANLRPRVPWDDSARSRADQAVRAEQARQKRERATPNGQAVPRSKSARPKQSVLSGLGEALVTNNIACHRCQSIQWLPEGWKESLAATDYYCSICDSLMLRR